LTWIAPGSPRQARGWREQGIGGRPQPGNNYGVAVPAALALDEAATADLRANRRGGW